MFNTRLRLFDARFVDSFVFLSNDFKKIVITNILTTLKTFFKNQYFVFICQGDSLFGLI